MIKKFFLTVLFVFCASCTRYESISRPAILGDFRIYTTSGKEVVLKSSEISADSEKVYVLSHQTQFNIGKTRYFIMRGGYYEGDVNVLVNGDSGKTVYFNDFDELIRTKKDEVFIRTVGNEAYSPTTDIIIFSIDAEGNLVERFRAEGIFEEISQVTLEGDNGFKFKARKIDSSLKEIRDVLITYQNGQFTQEKIEPLKHFNKTTK